MKRTAGQVPGTAPGRFALKEDFRVSRMKGSLVHKMNGLNVARGNLRPVFIDAGW